MCYLCDVDQVVDGVKPWEALHNAFFAFVKLCTCWCFMSSCNRSPFSPLHSNCHFRVYRIPLSKLQLINIAFHIPSGKKGMPIQVSHASKFIFIVFIILPMTFPSPKLSQICTCINFKIHSIKKFSFQHGDNMRIIKSWWKVRHDFVAQI